jgi:hypothetical protein
MGIIKATAYPNELTKDAANDYYLLPQSAGTLYDDDIIRRLEAKEIATKNVNGKAFVELFHRECAMAVAEGYSVVTGLFRASVSKRRKQRIGAGNSRRVERHCFKATAYPNELTRVRILKGYPNRSRSRNAPLREASPPD